MRSLIILILLTTAASAEPATRAERAWIVDYFTNTMRDPYSLRSTGISEVREIRGYYRPIPEAICVQFNAKNGAGGYAGIDRLVFVRTPQGLVHGDGNRGVTDLSCRVEGVSYAPFPELAAIR